MPNGHGVPLGCSVCKRYEEGQENPLMGHCLYHKSDVHMDLVCADFDKPGHELHYPNILEKGMLYAFVDVEGYGYPGPTERVPLAKISEYRDWGDKERKRAWAEAQKRANAKYEERLDKD